MASNINKSTASKNTNVNQTPIEHYAYIRDGNLFILKQIIC